MMEQEGGVGDKVSDVSRAIRPADHWECGIMLFVWLFHVTFSITPTVHMEKPSPLSAFFLLHWILFVTYVTL